MTDSEANKIFAEAKEAILSQDAASALEIAQKGLASGIKPMDLLNKGFIPGITEVGDRFGRGTLFLPELIQAAKVMQSVIDMVNERIEALGDQSLSAPVKILIATVKGDVHDIGKAILVAMLKANGFKVFDLGRDVPNEKIIEQAEKLAVDIIGTSALLTNTMGEQQKLEKLLRERGLREKYKTMVGGAPVTQRWANRIGADAYAEDAVEAVNKVKELLGRG